MHNNSHKLTGWVAGLLSMVLTLIAPLSPIASLAGQGSLPRPSLNRPSLGNKKVPDTKLVTSKMWQVGKATNYSNKNIIVKFSSKGVADRSQIVRKYGSSITDKVDGTRSYLASLPKSQSVDSFIDKLEATPGVVSAEPDYIVKALGEEASWGFDQINAASAQADNSATGSGVIVAVVDTGVDYTHEDLAANSWTNPGEVADNATDDDGNGYIDDVKGWDFIDESIYVPRQDNEPLDDYGHGTHVSGIIAAVDNSVGVIGVAPDATIMPVKVLDSQGYGLVSTIASGIRYATDNGADIINLSLGTSYPSVTLREAIAYANSNGVAVVAAAGNAYSFNLYSSYPALYESVISVAATEETYQQKTWWSNWGKVDISAPGDGIMSTIIDNRYARYSGTSMASPFVAGALALVKELHPGFTPAQLRQVVETTATENYVSGKNYVVGSGLLNAFAATDTLSESFSLTISKHRIIANDGGSDGTATITATVLDSDGAPDAGQSIAFATSLGTIAGSPAVTDADGRASVTLTADDVNGLARITATNATYGSATVEIVVFNDSVEIRDIDVTSDEFGCDEWCEEEEVTITNSYYTFNVSLRALQLAYFDLLSGRQVDIDYQVLDELSNPVPDMSGTLSNQVVSIYGTDVPISLNFDPEVLTEQQYTFEVTVTDDESGKTDTASIKVNVGDTQKILIVAPKGQAGWGTYASVDPYDLDLETGLGTVRKLGILSALDSLGEKYDLVRESWFDWFDTDTLAKYPVVIFLGAMQYDESAIQSYLDMGGNALVSGNSAFYDAVNEDNASSGWCANTDTPFESSALHFTCLGTNAYNYQVYGMAGSIFEGMTFDINSLDLSGDGNLDQLYVDEITPDDSDDAALEYSSGIDSPAVAGLTVDDGNSKLVFAGFGIGGIHDSGSDSRADFLTAVLDYFQPDGVSVDSVTPTVVDKGVAKRLTISGEGFVMTGTTTVELGSTELTNVEVLDRNTIEATVPSNYPSVGVKTLTVTNPFGQSDSLASAVTVRYRAPVISSATPKTLSNDKARKITINGKYFRSGATAKLGTKSLTSVTVVSDKVITAMVPKNINPGKYSLVVTNSDGRSDTYSTKLTVRYGFTFDLRYGMQGEAVKILQERLQKEGYFPANLTTTIYFRTYTYYAVLSYQKAKGLARTGVVNLETRNYLNNH